MSRVWNSRSPSSERTFKVRLRSPQQRRSPSKYAIEDFEEDLSKISGKRSTKRKGVSPSAVVPAVESTPERGRSKGRKKKGKKRDSSSSSSLSSLSTVSRSRSRSRSSSSSSQEVFGKPSRKVIEVEEYATKKKKHKKKSKKKKKSHSQFGYFGENFQYYHILEDCVNREKQADKCRTSKKAIQFIEHTKNRSTTYLKRSGSLILAAKELEIQTHCHISLHIQPTWARGKQYRYLSGSNVHPIRSAEYADRWVGPNMCQVCGGQRETSTWLVCRHSSSRRKQGCTYKVHCNCIGIYYTSALELNQVPFYCPKHGRNHRMAQQYYNVPFSPQTIDESNISPGSSGVNGRQLVERSKSGSVLVHDSNAPLGSEVIHVIDSTTGLRSALKVDSTTASGTEMLLHFHSSIVQSAEMTGDPSTPMVLELPSGSTAVPVSQVAGDSNVIQTQVVTTEARPESDNVNIKVEPGTSQVVEQQVDSQDEDKNTDLIDYSTLPGGQQVVSVEEVRDDSFVESEQIEEVEVASEVIPENQQVVVMSEDGTIIQGGEQIVVQEVEMDGEYIEVPQGEMVVQTSEGTQQQLDGRTVVYVSESQINDPSGGVVFQMAEDGQEQVVYTQEPGVVQETVMDISPTKLEKVQIDPNQIDPNQPQEVDAASLPPGTEIVHIVDSNTAMVLEVQSDANALS